MWWTRAGNEMCWRHRYGDVRHNIMCHMCDGNACKVDMDGDTNNIMHMGRNEMCCSVWRWRHNVMCMQGLMDRRHKYAVEMGWKHNGGNEMCWRHRYGDGDT